jgi:hypothetical protein
MQRSPKKATTNKRLHRHAACSQGSNFNPISHTILKKNPQSGELNETIETNPAWLQQATGCKGKHLARSKENCKVSSDLHHMNTMLMFAHICQAYTGQ